MKRIAAVLILWAIAFSAFSCVQETPPAASEETSAETAGTAATETEAETAKETDTENESAWSTETEPETGTETETDTETAPEVTTAAETETAAGTETTEAPETAPGKNEKLNIKIETVTARAESTADVRISFENVTELMSAALVVKWDGRLKLKDAKYAPGGGMTSVPDKTGENGEPDWSGVKPPFMFNWLTLNPARALTADTVFVTLTFEVPDGAKTGDTYAVTATADPDNTFDTNEKNVDFVIINGGINVR